MRILKSGQLVLLPILVFSVGVWVYHLWLIFLAEPSEREAAYHVLSPFLSAPYVFASGLLALVLLRKVGAARRAAAAVFAVFPLSGVLWWAFAPERPHLAGSSAALGRLWWLILLPLAFAGALYLPSVTRFINQLNESSPTDQEVS